MKNVSVILELTSWKMYLLYQKWYHEKVYVLYQNWSHEENVWYVFISSPELIDKLIV